MTSSSRDSTRTVPEPLSFTLGFVGPRRLGPTDQDHGAWDLQLRRALDHVARGLRARLPAGRTLCLVGALARGADLAIAEELLERGALLRVLLPEPLDRFLDEHDFPDPAERNRVVALLERPACADVRVASTSSNRRERFTECASRIVRDSEALLCVRHWDAENGRGGTEETVVLARTLGRPLIEVRLQAAPDAEAKIVFPDDWIPQGSHAPLPFPIPDPRTVVAGWKARASAEAGRSKLHIVRAAAWTVGLQLGATFLAVVTYHRPEWDVVGLLVKLAVIVTVASIALVSARHAFNARWTARRFTAEMQRSWAAVRGLRGSAEWLEDELPLEFTAHGRDLALLHGLDRGHEADDEPAFRRRYATERLAGQRAYSLRTARSASRGRRLLRTIFHVCIGSTLLALITKLALRAFGDAANPPDIDEVCSLISILGPAIGAAAVSFVALLDLEARSQTQTRLAEFLERQQRQLAACTDWSSTRQVVVTTERRLLDEVRSWHARHAYRK